MEGIICKECGSTPCNPNCIEVGLSSAESAVHERLVMLDCPFCGGDAEIKRMGTNRVSMIIGCADCGCTLETGETFINEHSQWNTRET